MKCPECRQDNREGAKFCDACGAPLQSRCPACHTLLRPQAKFCDECGHGLASAAVETATSAAADRLAQPPFGYTPRHLAEKILTSRTALEGERKLVTVVFADCAEFTALSSKLDPEELHNLMDGCFQRVLDAVHGYEGTVNQFTGDGVMALFGAPIAHGYLTLSLLPRLTAGLLEIAGTAMAVNYGLDKVRFLQPVIAGSKVRAVTEIRSVEPGSQGYRVGMTTTVELEGGARPALVAETLALIVPEA